MAAHYNPPTRIVGKRGDKPVTGLVGETLAQYESRRQRAIEADERRAAYRELCRWAQQVGIDHLGDGFGLVLRSA